MILNLDLGYPYQLSGRRLTITRMPGAKDPDNTAITPIYDNTLSGSTQYVQITNVTANQIWQMTLVDTLTTARGGVTTSKKDVLCFNTGSQQFPGPKSGDRLKILSMEFESSSSSSSSSSNSSSSSLSSSSSSSSG